MTTLFDDVTVSGTRRTNDGYLVADVKVARTGIQIYGGYEVDPDNELGLRDMAQVRVYRPEEEVFDQAALTSYAYRPVTNDHPRGNVNADNWKQLSVGQTGGEVVRDGDWVRVPMVLMDSSMISVVEGGKRQLSMGYTCSIEAQDGVSPDGEPYDAIQRSMRMNHLAVVAAARAGNEAKIGDKEGSLPITQKEDSMSTKTVVLGDEAVNIAADEAPKLEAFKVSIAKKLADAEAAHASEMAKVEAERDDLRTKLADAEKKVLTTEALDAAVVARADLIAKAKSVVADVKTDGLSDFDIRKAVVVAKFGDSMNSKSEAYIENRFDILMEDQASTGQVAQAIQTMPAVLGGAAAYDAAVAKQKSNLNARFRA